VPVPRRQGASSVDLRASATKAETIAKRIPVAGPWITQKEIDYVADAAANAWYDKAGIYNERFESAFARYVGSRYAISLPSCTSAIHLSLRAMGIGEGDEVIVPDVTWIATAAPIAYVGATPVFADIDPETWCLSADAAEACVTARTKAIIPVDLYGGMPNWDDIRAVAAAHSLRVIEDAAEAVGSEYRGSRAGSFGDTGVFSFHGSKTLTTGEGGMLVTDDPVLYDRALVLRDHGRKPGDVAFFNREVAFKYKMSSLQAALGLAQTERVRELIEFKRTLFAWYQEELRGFDGVTLNAEPLGVVNSYWMVTVVLDLTFGLKKEQVIERMRAAGIDCRPFFYPLSSIPAYAGTVQAEVAVRRNVNSYRVSPYGVNLPSGFNMTRELVATVCENLRSILVR